MKQTSYWPPFEKWSQKSYNDPYLTVSVVLYVLTVTGLAIDLALSLYWSGFLWTTAALNHRSNPWIWFSHAQKIPWLSDKPQHSNIPRPHQLVIGAPSQPPASKSIPTGLKAWLTTSTMFRRFGALEPLSYSLLRGGLALLCCVVLLVYGAFHCAIHPISQFTTAKGLPTRSLTQDTRPAVTFGNIAGFIVRVNVLMLSKADCGVFQALNVTTLSQFPSHISDKLSLETCDAIRAGIKANFTNPATGQGEV